MNITELYFSPTGGTQKAADLFTQALAGQVQTVDLCDSRADFSAVSLSAEDLAVIAVPSYGGRVPAVAIQRLAAVHGNGAAAVLMVVYGNRAFDKAITLNAQFGEGWLLPAEMLSLAKKGITHVISLQPFGCIANHIVSKGIEKRIKTLVPDMNILSLDFDSGVSEVNIINRVLLFTDKLENRPSYGK